MQQPESLANEELLLRISFIFAGGFALAEGLQNWIRGKIDTHPEVVVVILIVYAVAFANLAVGMSSVAIIKKLRHMPLVTLVGIILASAYVIMEVEFSGAYRSDSLAFTHYAASLYLGGKNPYGLDLQNALRAFSVDPAFITLTPSGSIVTTLNYPALSFLIFVPAVLAGIGDMRVMIFIFEIAALVSIYLWAPSNIRPVVLLPVFAGADLAVDFNAGCIADFLWVLPLILMLFSIKRPWLSGAFYGVSCAIKQTPWLLAPFLLIWMYCDDGESSRTARLRRVAVFTGMTAVLFLLPNLEFINGGLLQWWEGVVTPSFGNLVILSQGLSMVSELGYVPLPPHFYSIVMVAVFLTLIFNYAVYFDKLKHIIWVMPVVTLWFSYRGLQNYFIFWVPMLVASAVYIYKERIRV